MFKIRSYPPGRTHIFAHYSTVPYIIAKKNHNASILNRIVPNRVKDKYIMNLEWKENLKKTIMSLDGVPSLTAH
jgi:hypothetical protein